jgi:hypothetical protein
MTKRTVLRIVGGRPGLRRLLMPSFLAASVPELIDRDFFEFVR